MPRRLDFIDVMAKHLPPSSSTLRMLDVGGQAGGRLLELRPDLAVEIASFYVPHWDYATGSIDSVVGYDVLLRPEFLAAVQKVMRPGGRMIIVNSEGVVDHVLVQALESAGLVRILVEPALGRDGVLIRGEKPHKTSDTLARVQQVAEEDAARLDFVSYRGRFVHLLIRQTPNKPVWKLQPDDVIRWQSVAVNVDGVLHLLAFSSLPRAVSFMQPAVLENFIQDVNKVGKFSKEIAQTWDMPILLNPTLESIRPHEVMMIDIDPTTAEAPDE